MTIESVIVAALIVVVVVGVPVVTWRRTTPSPPGAESRLLTTLRERVRQRQLARGSSPDRNE